ncbi:MAG: helix-turn-helix domain-containing protein [Nitrospirae bacterium]|nr:MAG: helix-turn-helix domain-containing protein [Nitrospirota bacterium]
MDSNGYAIVPDGICPACGADDGFVVEARDWPIHHKGRDGVVHAVKLRYCKACGEGFSTGDGEMQRMADAIKAFVREIDLAQAHELRATRKRLGLKQSEAAALFGGGVNAFSEYERGIRQPSKSTVLLLKLLDRHPELLGEIRAAG